MSSAPESEPGQLLGAIFAASPDAVIVIDAEGTIILASPAVTTLFGYYPEELVGAPIEHLVPLDRRDVHKHHVEHFFAAPQSRQMGVGLELAGRHRDGREFAVEVSLTPVEARGRRYAAAFVRDASESQRAVSRLRAVDEVTQQLLSGSSAEEIFPIVAQRARWLSRSDAVWIVRPSTSGPLEIVSADGAGADILLGERLSAETSRSGAVMWSESSELIEDLSTAENVPAHCRELDLGPGLYVPLAADERRLGTIVFARVHGTPAFSQLDVAFAEVFASAITAAIELGEARAEVESLGIVAEDERIARDLHDTVIQQLFAVGMSLQATRAGVTGSSGERIDNAINSLDDVIKQIRNTIFRLPGRTEMTLGLREEMLRLADKYREELGFVPRVAFEGPVDAAVPEVIVEHLLQVFREGLSNIARHAHASVAEAIVTVENEWLVLNLIDDGQGVSDGPSAGSGLRNIAQRATELGGKSDVRPRSPRGTVVEWRVPI